MSDTDHLPEDDARRVALVRIADHLRAAKETHLYKHLVSCAESAEKGAIAAFLNCDPADAGTVAKHQARILMCREFPRWIDEQIAVGAQAEADLRAAYDDYDPEAATD